jgi:hypothetical protein
VAKADPLQLQLEMQYYPDLPAPNVRERVCLERVTIRTLNDTSADSPLDSSAVGFPVIAGLNRNWKSGILFLVIARGGFRLTPFPNVIRVVSVSC